MSQHKRVSFLVVGTSLFAASCVTVYAQPGRANQPVLAPRAGVLAQTTATPEISATEGPAQPEATPPASASAEAATPGAEGPPHGPPSDANQGWGRGALANGHMGGDPEKIGPTDHQRVVGRWGIEARSVGTLQASPNNPNPSCSNGPCDVRLTSVGVRRWLSDHYAYSVGLTLAMGGGSTSGLGSWDTHVGVGPTAGAYFLLSQWKHLAVSATPQLGLLYFAPSGSGNKTFIANVAGKVEAELQLGFISLPGVAIGTDAGLTLQYRNTGNDSQDAGGFSQWSVDTVGGTSLWGLVTNAFVRFYL